MTRFLVSKSEEINIVFYLVRAGNDAIDALTTDVLQVMATGLQNGAHSLEPKSLDQSIRQKVS